MKTYVSTIIGEQYIIPTLAIWDNVEQINLDTLPNQFVLKCTHDSGSVVICKDKTTFDLALAKKTLRKKFHQNLFWWGREWVYKDVKPRIIAEQYLEDEQTAELRDYKFFCFNGDVKLMFIATGRQNPDQETAFDFFDMDYQHLPIRNGHPFAGQCPEKPQCFAEMVKLARKLSAGIPHVRVDFYEVNGRVYFGELTFFQNSGLVPMEPDEWDEIMGSWIDLSIVKNQKN